MCQSHSFFLWNHFWVTFIDIWWFFLVTLIVIQTYSGLFVLPCVDASISFWLSLFLSVWPDGWMGYSFFIWSITTIKICPEIVKESSKFPPPPHTHTKYGPNGKRICQNGEWSHCSLCTIHDCCTHSSETLVWAGTGPSGLAPGSSKAPMTSCFYSLNVATL